MGQLEGKTAVILGAASEGNMGQTIARLFAKEGAKVMVAGRKEAPLAALAEEIGGAYALCDIAKKPEVNAMADKAAATFGRVDIAINTTGWGLLASLEEITDEQLDQIVDLQFKGVTKYLINSPFGALTLGAAYLTAALTATWFVVMAAKLDGVVEVSWGLASAPCWLALGCALVFSVFALGFHVPGYPLFGLVRGPPLGIVMIRKR